MTTTLVRRSDIELRHFHESGVFLGDGIARPMSDTMSAGWARYEPGAANPWLVDYDEVITVIEGSFTIESDGDLLTASPGDLLFLRKGTELVYRSDEGALIVYVAYPQWEEAAKAAGRI